MYQKDNDMERFASLINGLPDNLPPPSAQPTTISENKIAPAVSLQQDSDMERFNSLVSGMFSSEEQTSSFEDFASKTITEAVENSEDEELQEALITEKLPNDKGVRVGSWKIVTRKIREGEKIKKRFYVRHSATNQDIAQDLWLYEAAYALVKFLNKGLAINDNEIKEVLRLEEQYVKYKNDVISFKHAVERYISKKDYGKAEIYETRFDFAKEQAKLSVDSIKRLAKLNG